MIPLIFFYFGLVFKNYSSLGQASQNQTFDICYHVSHRTDFPTVAQPTAPSIKGLNDRQLIIDIATKK